MERKKKKTIIQRQKEITLDRFEKNFPHGIRFTEFRNKGENNNLIYYITYLIKVTIETYKRNESIE